MKTYKVFSLDVWGHSHADCCALYGCDCIGTDEDTGEETLSDDCQCEGYTVNDRCSCGTIKIDEDVSGEQILAVLDNDGYIHKNKCVIGDDSDDMLLFVNSVKDGRPLLQLEQV